MVKVFCDPKNIEKYHIRELELMFEVELVDQIPTQSKKRIITADLHTNDICNENNIVLYLDDEYFEDEICSLVSTRHVRSIKYELELISVVGVGDIPSKVDCKILRESEIESNLTNTDIMIIDLESISNYNILRNIASQVNHLIILHSHQLPEMDKYSFIKKSQTDQLFKLLSDMKNSILTEYAQNRIIRGFLIVKKMNAFLVKSSTVDGLSFLYRAKPMLLEYHDYSDSKIRESIIQMMSAGDQLLELNARIVLDSGYFYGVLILAFSQPDSTSSDSRLQEESIYAICLHIPRRIVSMMPRDEALTHMANIAQSFYHGSFDFEYMQNVKISIINEIEDLIGI